MLTLLAAATQARRCPLRVVIGGESAWPSGAGHFSSTSTLAPLAASCVAAVRPPTPPPMTTASYTTSVRALPVLATASATSRSRVRSPAADAAAAAAARRRPRRPACRLADGRCVEHARLRQTCKC